MREAPPPPRAPRPFLTFFVSLAGSSAVLAMLLLWDHRVLELRRARDEVKQLEVQIAARGRENDELRLAIEAAKRHEFPAERVAREELHLVHPEDIVLLYPAGSLTEGRDGKKALPPPAAKVNPR
jgi:cell division protein FtsB